MASNQPNETPSPKALVATNQAQIENYKLQPQRDPQGGNKQSSQQTLATKSCTLRETLKKPAGPQ